MAHFENGFSEFWEVLVELVNPSRRMDVLWAFRDDGYKVKLEDIKGYYQSEGLDVVLKEMLLLYDGLLDKEIIMDFGISENVPFENLVKYASPNEKYDNYELTDILNNIEDDDLEAFKAFFTNIKPENLDEDTMREILDMTPYEAYGYANRYLQLLPEDVRIRIKSDYCE